ncbi:LADA_0H14774g1_1 [Lachancea dasiensis]|uniref:LADA_0H14774g1_1 n=1 Tax=Lachancea dasiensis TaxID=1072105 RepID=A0A1G4K4K3_9SACH|nr:LADA_0H14774g1_1 [Lachancea dasiensis]
MKERAQGEKGRPKKYRVYGPQPNLGKANVRTQLTDPMFEEVFRDFKHMRRLLKTLLMGCDSYSDGMASFVEGAIGLSSHFESILNNSEKWRYRLPTRKLYAPSGSPFVHDQHMPDSYQYDKSPLEPLSIASQNCMSQNFLSKHNVRNFRCRQEVARGRIKADLKLMDRALRQPLVRVHELCLQISELARARETCVAKVLDCTAKYDQWREKNRKHMGPRQVRDKLRHARDLELERMKYESLNATTKVKVQVFLTLFARLMEKWVEGFILNSYSLAFTLYSNIGCAEEVFGMVSQPVASQLDGLSAQDCVSDGHLIPPETCPPHGAGCASGQAQMPMQDIVTKFRSDIDCVNMHMSDLRITDFARFYNATICSAKESAKTQSQEYAIHGSVPLLYATALYDYGMDDAGYQLGDLTFHRGEVIRVIRKNDPSWWYGESMRTKHRGYLPSNYIVVERYT